MSYKMWCPIGLTRRFLCCDVARRLHCHIICVSFIREQCSESQANNDRDYHICFCVVAASKMEPLKVWMSQLLWPFDFQRFHFNFRLHYGDDREGSGARFSCWKICPSRTYGKRQSYKCTINYEHSAVTLALNLDQYAYQMQFTVKLCPCEHIHMFTCM